MDVEEKGGTKNASNIIEHQIDKPLNSNETRPGYIYAFKVVDPEGRGYLKIGTTMDIKAQLQQHHKCYPDIEFIYSTRGEDVIHIARMENLIHAELVEDEMTLERCPGGKHGHHHEFFNVVVQHTIAVLRKWSKWSSTSPYYMELRPSILPSHSPKGKARREPAKEDSPTGKSPPARSQSRDSPRDNSPITFKKPEWSLRCFDDEDLLNLYHPLSWESFQQDHETPVDELRA